MTTDRASNQKIGLLASGPVLDDELEQLRRALDAYDAALMSNDVEALDRWFLDDPQTLRAHADGVLVGHEQISAYRRASLGAPARQVEHLHLFALTRDAVMAVAETRRPDRTLGLQSQAWVRTDDGWRIAVAHVSAGPTPDTGGDEAGGPRPQDRNLWRALGDPLVRGVRSGPLDNLTLAVKDIFSVAGHRVGAGNSTWLAQASPEPRNADAVQALLDAGAAITGIAQTDEFAYSLAGTNIHYGTPQNPAAPGRITGGSSSGSASAVALGLVDVGLGSDTAGSIRIPASYCDLSDYAPATGPSPPEDLSPSPRPSTPSAG